MFAPPLETKKATCTNKLCDFIGPVWMVSSLLEREKETCPKCGFKTLDPYYFEMSDATLEEISEAFKSVRLSA